MRERFPSLSETLERVATIRIRNMGTVGGNLAHADPAQDPPATLLALGAWRMGDGARACVAADRALAAEPGYPLADLLVQALQAAIPPGALEAEPPRRRGSRVTSRTG